MNFEPPKLFLQKEQYVTYSTVTTDNFFLKIALGVALSVCNA